ncbi:MAG: LuxR C-terminal-related transcriptional regulator [Dehalococcoidia bacterium]
MNDWIALSQAEKVALGHVALGRTNREIAVEMGLMPESIRTMLWGVSRTLGAESRSELRAIATSARLS